MSAKELCCLAFVFYLCHVWQSVCMSVNPKYPQVSENWKSQFNLSRCNFVDWEKCGKQQNLIESQRKVVKLNCKAGQN